MLSAFLVFFKYSFNCDMNFKIINRLKVNYNNIKFKDNFKIYITVGKTRGEHWKNSYHFPVSNMGFVFACLDSRPTSFFSLAS
jgi:hypothetical protein